MAKSGSISSWSEASTLTLSSKIEPYKPAKPRKATAFNHRSKPSGLIDNKAYSWDSVRQKSLSQRRTDRLDDTAKWLDSKGMLSKSDKEWLANLSDVDKAKLTKLLKVNKHFSGGVKSPEDRNKIRAQVVLMAAKSRDLKLATIHRQRLTETPYRKQPRLYKLLNEESFFDPKQVAIESNRRYAQAVLAAQSKALARASDDPGYSGTRVTKSTRMYEAVTSLLDKDLLDHDSAIRLAKVLHDEPNRVDILMNIDEKKVPNKADRQKIRQAVLLRAAHFGTDEARDFKTKLIESGKPSFKIDTPKVNAKEARQDKDLAKMSKNAIHPDNAPPDLNAMYIGNPNKQDVNFFDENRSLNMSFDVPCHKQLFALDAAGDPDSAAREQWDAIADKDFDPRTGISAIGVDAATMEGPIHDIIDHTVKMNNISKVDFVPRRADAVLVLKGINSMLPKNISLKERMQALAEAAAVFLLPTGDYGDQLGNLDQAMQKWPKRQTNDGFGITHEDPTKHLEDAGFLKEELHTHVNQKPIGANFIFSPPLRSLMEPVQAANLDEHRQEVRPTLDAVFGDQLSESGKTDALRYTFKQDGFYGREALFRQSCLDKLNSNVDAAEVRQIMQPLHNAMGKIATKVGNHPRQGLLANILMSTFLREFHMALDKKVRDDEMSKDEALNGTNKAKTKEALRDAVNQTLEYCDGLENASTSAAHGWVKAHKSDERSHRSVSNIEAGAAQPYAHTLKELRKLNEEWKNEMQKPLKPVAGSDDDVVDNGIIEVYE